MGKKKKQKRDTTLPSDAELLSELATLDNVEAWIPTDTDHQQGITPAWCEVVLKVNRSSAQVTNWPLSWTATLTRHDAELIIAVLHQVLHPTSGGTVADMLRRELDEVVDRIQARVDRGKDPLKKDVGLAQGLTRSIAIMVSPYAYDEDEIKAEAMARYEARNGLADEDD